MKKLLLVIALGFSVLQAEEALSQDDVRTIEESMAAASKEPGAVLFTPPTGWQIADPKALPASVKIMVVGKGMSEFPPSMNLGAEPFKGTLKDYLKIVKSINDSQGTAWKDLGQLKTQAGETSLSQVDVKTEWGEVRMMHVILVKDGTAYVLTSAALKDEFSKFYQDFFNSMKSLRINPS